MINVGFACGLNIKDLGLIFFLIPDNIGSPDINENGPFGAVGLCMPVGTAGKP